MAENPDDGLTAGLWLSVADLARRKGKTRQSINERVQRLEADGRITVRRQGRSKLVNLAEYDRAVGEVGDAAKEAAIETRGDADSEAVNPAFRDHQTREKKYAADLKFLDLEERLGRLLPVADIEDAAQRAAETLVRVIDRLPIHAERVATAVGREGPMGARATLKDIARELRASIAEAMNDLASAPLTLPEDAPAPA